MTLRRPRAMRWFMLISLLILTLGFGGYFGVQWWLYALHHVYTDDARVKGTLITISSEVAGRLVILAVEEGQRIKRVTFWPRFSRTNTRPRWRCTAQR